MPRMIDADKLKNHYAWWEIGDGEITYAEAKKRFDTIIDVQPTVDAEPVVRCDDCIYRDGKTPGQPNILCWQMHADDFCSYGTKREVGTYCKDIVTVRHGHWIYTPTEPLGYVCSECGKSSCSFNYCPNCGAKMDEVIEDAKHN